MVYRWVKRFRKSIYITLIYFSNVPNVEVESLFSIIGVYFSNAFNVAVESSFFIIGILSMDFIYV